MSTFIIFGATGAVGGFLLPQLLARGERIHAPSRNPSTAAAAGVTWTHGDLYGEVGSLPPRADCLISLGPLDAFAAWFARNPIAGVRRVLALSSMSADSKSESADAHERALAQRLRAAEALLATTADARGVGWTVFRPTLIYGSGRDRSLAPIARFARRWRVLPLPLGAHGLRQPVHAADLAQAIVQALDCAPSCGKTYALGGGERLSFTALLRRIGAAIPGFVLPVPLPSFVLRAALAVRARGQPLQPGAAALQRLGVALIADNSAAVADFGYAPRAFVAADVLAAGTPQRRT